MKSYIRVDTDQPLRAPDPPVLIEPLDEDLGTIYTTSPLRERELEELNRLREENAELRAALELEVQERRIREYRLVVARRLQQQGVPVEFMPDEVYPRMPYLILGPFMEKRDRAYSLNHALRLIRRGVIHALTVAGRTLLLPEEGEKLLMREAATAAGEIKPGPPKGSYRSRPLEKRRPVSEPPTYRPTRSRSP